MERLFSWLFPLVFQTLPFGLSLLEISRTREKRENNIIQCFELWLEPVVKRRNHLYYILMHIEIIETQARMKRKPDKEDKLESNIIPIKWFPNTYFFFFKISYFFKLNNWKNISNTSLIFTKLSRSNISMQNISTKECSF